MQEQKDMTGVLFKNKRKEQDKHPDYVGKAMVEGYAYELSAWIKESKKGEKFMSIAIRPPREINNASPEARDLDDDIPF